MKHEILIIGTGGANFAQKALHDIGHKNAVIVSPEEISNDFSREPEPYIINRHPPIPELYEGKKFVCKGVHKYREERTTINDVTSISWVCQCGRKL
jgi:hypothetical protein